MVFFKNAVESKGRSSFNKSLLVLFWTMGYPLLAMLIAPNARHHNRYMIPLIPFYILLAVIGLSRFLYLAEHYLDKIRVISPLGKFRITPQQFSTTILVLVMGVSIYLLVGIWSYRFATDVENINDQQVAMGRWVKEHIPPGMVIALSDIGAITYISGRKKIIDMVGLVNPQLLTALKKSDEGYQEVLWNYLLEERPDYIITHPNCYPLLVENKDVLTEVHEIELPRYGGISAGRKMVVYRTKWKKN